MLRTSSESVQLYTVGGCWYVTVCELYTVGAVGVSVCELYTVGGCWCVALCELYTVGGCWCVTVCELYTVGGCWCVAVCELYTVGGCWCVAVCEPVLLSPLQRPHSPPPGCQDGTHGCSGGACQTWS